MHEPDFVGAYYADKDLSLLKKLTLVIPTYNRNYYLSRCLWYHAHFPFGEIIVADSSPEEKKVVNRETVAKVREMFEANIRYLEYEPETEKYGGIFVVNGEMPCSMWRRSIRRSLRIRNIMYQQHFLNI